MTFISSVIAKEGVAIISDSLVTTSHPVIEFNDFVKFFESKSKKTKNSSIKLDPKEIVDLFETKPHHTKDFEEKLFEYDKYTAITTAGSANINGKRIKDIIEEIKDKNTKDRGYKSKKIETKVKDFCENLTKEVKDHLSSKTTIRNVTFIITNFNPKKNITSIYKVNVVSASQKNLNEDDFEFVTYSKTNDYEKVVCDGQNRISEKILFGDFPTVYNIIPKIAMKLADDFNIDKKKITKKYIDSLRKDKDIVPKSMFSDMKIIRLSDLSLQQAVDLASLLMRLEIDFQNYTEEIPTVGGVIKLAVIDKKGFRHLSGHEIEKPNNI